MSIKIAPLRIGSAQLREVVAGRDAVIPRRHAMALLLASDVPDRERDFMALLETEAESPQIRYLAAVSLGRLGTPSALNALIENILSPDERILAGVMRALGRIGGPAALDAVLKVKTSATGIAASNARFAAALIFHRQGLEGNDLPLPTDKDFLAVPSKDTLPVQLDRASASEAALCLRCLALEPFGIEFDTRCVYRIRCRRGDRMILFNREVTGPHAVERLVERKAFPGVIATRPGDAHSYSASFVVLTSPARQSSVFNILICRTGGEPVFGGVAHIAGNRVEFLIRAISRPGAISLAIEGAFEDGGLEFKTAFAGTVFQKKRQPIKTRP